MNSLLAVFLIAALGYFIGGIRIKGIELGTAGVLLVALVFGHFGVEIPSIVRNFGLALFVCSVGFIAGPKFFRDFKSNAASYILLGFLIILSGGICAVLVSLIGGIRPELSIARFRGDLPERYRWAEGETKLEGALFTIDAATGKCLKAERVETWD